MSFTFSDRDGCFVVAYDYAKIDTEKLSRPEHRVTCTGGAYYQAHALCADFDSIRKGSIWIVEFDGHSWAPRSWDLKYAEYFWNDFGSAYPMRTKAYKCFNTPALFHIYKSLSRPFIPKEVYNNIEVGCRFPERLDTIFCTPTLEAATERFLTRSFAWLERRYENERYFSLE